jgi:hypothetical protein
LRSPGWLWLPPELVVGWCSAEVAPRWNCGSATDHSAVEVLPAEARSKLGSAVGCMPSSELPTLESQA